MVKAKELFYEILFDQFKWLKHYWPFSHQLSDAWHFESSIFLEDYLGLAYHYLITEFQF